MDWVRNVNKVWQRLGSQIFASLDLCASVQIHTWPSLLTAPSAGALCQETPQEHQTAGEMPKLKHLCVLRADVIWGGCCAQKLEGELTLTHLPQLKSLCPK